MTTEIHTATHKDVTRMVVYGSQFWTQTRYFKCGIAYDTESVIEMTEQLIDNGIVLYAEDENEIVALMLVIITPCLMNKNYMMAVEWVFYVDPDYRRSGLGVKLIAAAEHILQQRHVKFFTMVSLTHVTPDAANQLYETLGFEHSEANYTKELAWP